MMQLGIYWHFFVSYHIITEIKSSTKPSVRIVQAQNNDAEFKYGCKSFEPLNLSMYLMTHWPRRQISIFTACRIQSNANGQITLSLSSETLPAALRSTSSDLFIRSNNDQGSLASGLAVWRDLGGKSVYRMIRRLRMKPTDVERLSEPLCPDPDVRPPPHFNVNFTLTSFSASKTHSTAISADRHG